jgi:predicted dehydrogenase
MKKIRWGVLSTARIGIQKVIPAMQRGEYCEIAAIASRETNKAKDAAKELKIPKYYGSYEALLADPAIDAVYIPLPNHLHVPWAIKTLEAGKHVLCEKPIGMTTAEADSLLEASRRFPNLKIMEAFMYRHHPQWIRTLKMIRGDSIGELRTIDAFFSYMNLDSDNIRNQKEMGGGGLMDIGCYCVSISRFLFGKQPEKVSAVIDFDEQFKTDRLVSGLLDFRSGTATFSCATQLIPFQRVNIFGTKGRIDIEIPFNAPPDRPCRIWYDQKGMTEEIVFDICDQYTIQGDLFSLAVIGNSPVPTPLSDAVENMQVIDALFESTEKGGFVRLPAAD